LPGFLDKREVFGVSLERSHRKGVRFFNPWPEFEQHGFADFLRWACSRRSGRSELPGALSRLPPALPDFSRPRAAPGSLTATWIGHTTVLLQLGSLNVLTDPIWSERASPVSFAGPRRLTPPGVAFDELPAIDLILMSHNHYDHLDSTTVRRLISRFPAAAWRVPLGVGDFLRARGAKDVAELDWHGLSELAGVRLICVPAQHFSGRGFFDRNKTLWGGWVLKKDSRSVFFAGDTALNPSFSESGKRYGPFDLALMPIGAYDPRWFMRSVHLDPEECVRAVGMLAGQNGNVPTVLATHWGTFKLTDEPFGDPPLRMKTAWIARGYAPEKLGILRPGQTLRV